MSSTPRPPDHDPLTPPSDLPPDAGGPEEIEDELAPRPLDLHSPQFTLRAVLTGMLLAAILSVCNVYAGLKVGWSFNMSIVAALASYGVWQGLHFGFGTRKWGILENNINQTACSSGAAVSSAGLVAPVPALALLTGQELDWHFLALWCFSVMLVGITVAIAIRRQMLIVDKLPFAFGIASAETLKQMYGDGAEAMKRLGMLVCGGLAAGLVEHLSRLGVWWKPLLVPGTIKGYSLSALNITLMPNLLMYGVGGLIGIRAGISLLIGGLLGYVVLGPYMLDAGGAKLEAKASIAKPPAFVTEKFRKPPEGYLKYERGLKWEGVMTAPQRDELLALYGPAEYAAAWREFGLAVSLNPAHALQAVPLDYQEYRAAIRDFYVVSQLSVVKANEALAEKIRAVDRTVGTADVNALGDPDEVREAALAQLAAPATALAEKLSVAEGPDGFTAEQRDKLVGQVTGLEDELAKSIRNAHVASQPEVQAARAAFVDAVKAVDPEADVKATKPPAPGFKPLVVWLLWPGVTLMVISSLVSFAFSWRSVLAAMGFGGSGEKKTTAAERGEVSRSVFLFALVAVLALSTYLQVSFFAIVWWAAVLGVLLTFVLALVAARVAGETSITPVGAMGKVTQLFFGALIPGEVAPNLMAANVTGGAASQCADLLHDMRCGHMLGASPRLQAMAQVCGAFAGAMAGSAVYLLLIHDPQAQLLTPEWPGPAVVTWKAVAELFAVGWRALPPYALLASGIAAVIGVVFPILEKTLPKRAAMFVPSAASIGLALVVPVNYALTMFAGALIAWLLSHFFKKWSTRFLVTLCAGIVAGDTLVGASWGIFADTDWVDIWNNIYQQFIASASRTTGG